MTEISEKVSAMRGAVTKEDDYTGRRISELPDRVINSADELKRRFDAAVIEVLDPKHNQLAENAAAAIENIDERLHLIEKEGGTGQLQLNSDWNEDDATSKAYIKNKPELNNIEGVLSLEKGGTGASDQKSALKNLAAIGYMGMLTAADDLDTLTENGIYYYLTGDAPQNTPYSNASIVEVTGIPGEVRKIQRVTRYAAPNYSTYRASSAEGQWTEWSCTDIEDTSYAGCFYRTVNGVTEWVNPPLLDGVAYRTTRRVCGKPVYAQFRTFGKLPNTGQLQLAAGESGDEFDKVIVFDVFCTESNRRYKFPFINSSGAVCGNARFLGGRSFYIDTFSDISGYSGMYYIEYTLK